MGTGLAIQVIHLVTQNWSKWIWKNIEEENGSDNADCEEPNHSLSTADEDFEIEDDIDTLRSVVSLVKKTQLFR